MNLRAIAALFVLAALIASTSDAQTATSFIDPVDGLSLEQAIERALAEEPSIRAARTDVDVARGMRLQAGLRRNPSISTELRDEPSGSDNQTMVSVEWPLELGRRKGRITVADRETAAAELSVADRERILVAEVRGRFGDALIAVRDLAILQDSVDATERQYDLLRSRVEQGASPPLDRDLVDVELRRINADRSLQLGRAERAMFDLKRLLGMSPNDPLRLRESLEDVVQREAAIGAASADTGEQRTDVRHAAARVAVAEAKIDRAQRDARVDVSLFAGYMRMDSGFAQFGLSATGIAERVRGQFHLITGGAMVMLPMFNRNQGEVAAARAERAGAVASQQAALLSASTEIATARVLDQRAREAVQLYGGAAQTLARQNLSIVRQSYELGRTTVFEVLAEQKRYLDLERAYTAALAAAFEARTALQRALGAVR